jgi:transcriptional regulator with XRE-family HTH domain
MDPDQFRQHVTAHLIATGRTAAALAGEAHIDQSLMSKYLHADPRRRVRPSPRNLARLAPVLGTPYEELLRLAGYLPGDPQLAAVDQELALVTAAWPRLEEWRRKAIRALASTAARELIDAYRPSRAA